MNTKAKKKVYIVKCYDVHNMPNSNMHRSNTYNMTAFHNLDKAKEYANSKLDNMVADLLKYGFRVLMSTGEMTGKGNEVWIRRTKLLKDEYEYQTRLFELSIDSIDLI